MSAPADFQPAFVLHTRAYRDTSLLVDLFAVQSGRIGVVAKGARQRKGGLRSLLNPFVPLLVSWRGRSSLKTLTAAEADGAGLRLSGARLYSGFYLNELLMRLLPEADPHPNLYADYQHCLKLLQSKTEPLEPLLRAFELSLLAELGYAVDLQYDGGGSSLEADAFYQLEDQSGLQRVSNTQASGLYAGAHLLAIARRDFQSPDVCAAAKRLTRSMLAPLLGGRPLKSRELFGLPH